jgi:hypothetical protein
MIRFISGIIIFIPSAWSFSENIGDNSTSLWFSMYGIALGLMIITNQFDSYSLTLRRIIGLVILMSSLVYLAVDHSGSFNSILAFGGIALGGYLSDTLSKNDDRWIDDFD